MSISAYSQVGINTSNPKASLDVVAKLSDPNSPDGFIAPRLTGDELFAKNAIYGMDQLGAIIYVTTAPAAANQINDTKDVKTIGYYYHNGTKWMKMEGSGDPTTDAFVDDPENGMVKIGTTSQGTVRNPLTDFVIKDNGNVGVGVLNPNTKLDIEGNLRIGKVNSASSSNNLSTLVRDNTTGEVKSIISSSGNTFAFNYMTYNLSNVNKDWVNNFDTKISTVDYTLVIVGYSFNQQELISSTTSLGKSFYNPVNVYAFQSNNTWRLSADYNGGASSNNGTWTINCLIINNSSIKSLPQATFNLGGANTGSATNQPVGL